MRPGNKGGFFCPRKMPDGSFCKERSSGSASAPQSPPASRAAVESSWEPQTQATSPQHLLVLACLDFASRTYQGTGQSDDARALAFDTYTQWKAALQ